MSKETTEKVAEEDREIQRFTDYFEEELPESEAEALRTEMKSDLGLAARYKSFEETMNAISGMHKMRAPVDFEKRVEETIHARSGGRFFGRRAFGDRIPFEIIAVVVMVIAGAVYWAQRQSSTGSHKIQEDSQPTIRDGAEKAMPQL